MARGLDTLRKALRTLAAKSVGEREHNPRYFTEQLRASKDHTEIVSLPSRPKDSLQELNPASPHFGKRYFIVGFDAVGDPDHPVR